MKGDLSRMLTEKRFNEPNSPDAGIIIEFLVKLNFYQHALVSRSSRDVHVIRFHDTKRQMPASEFNFLPGRSVELGGRLRLILQKEKRGTHSNDLDPEIFAINGVIKENKCNTTTKHRISFIQFQKNLKKFQAK